MAQGELSGIVISHDLPMIARLCDQLTVMYRGRVVEEGPIDALGDQDAPNHPYTRELKERAEDLAQGRHSTRARVDDGSPDSTGVVADPGCVYRSRCLIYRLRKVDREKCANSVPALHGTVSGGPRVACHVSDTNLLADLPGISAEYRTGEIDALTDEMFMDEGDSDA
jgi:ABC-type dipeptide/oligopeptide/nickel transport system ATPase component